MIPLSKVIAELDPNADVSCCDNDIDNIVWHKGTPIAKDVIEAKQSQLQAEYDAEEWKRNRQAEYPSHEDCIHALLDGGNTLTELQEKRQAVKTKYPKP